MSDGLIDTQKEIDEACKRLAATEAIGVDTEFLRVRTYYSRLALVQVSCAESVYCLDPLAAGVNLEGLWRIFADPRITKVMHAARQDIEVLLQTAGVAPSPLFDTQIAAGLTGYGEQAGYAALVKEEFGETLPKTSQRTDWTRRPLSRDQLGYAANDVRYLLPLYRRLMHRLESLERLSWAEEDFRGILDPVLYEADPEQAYRRVGRGAHLKAPAQHRLKQLCAWRERTAQQRDLPRSWVMDDETLAAIAAAGPRNRQDLGRVAGVGDDVAERDGRAILAALEAVPETNTPLPWSRREPLTDAQKALKTKLIGALKARAAELDIAEAVLLTRADLERIARGMPPGEIVRGWRWEVMGPSLEGVLSSGSPGTAGLRAS